MVLSQAVARGLVVTVVAVDVAMACAGGWLVRQAAAQPLRVTLPGVLATQAAPSVAAAPLAPAPPAPVPPPETDVDPTPPGRRRAAATAADVASPPRVSAATPDAGVTPPDAAASIPDAAPPPPDAPPPDLTTRIRSKIDAQRAAIQQCQAEVPDTPAGRIDIHLTVLPEGDVAEVRVVKNDTGSDPLGGCLVRLISGWRFPGPSHEAIEYVWPFLFTSAASP